MLVVVLVRERNERHWSVCCSAVIIWLCLIKFDSRPEQQVADACHRWACVTRSAENINVKTVCCFVSAAIIRGRKKRKSRCQVSLTEPLLQNDLFAVGFGFRQNSMINTAAISSASRSAWPCGAAWLQCLVGNMLRHLIKNITVATLIPSMTILHHVDEKTCSAVRVHQQTRVDTTTRVVLNWLFKNKTGLIFRYLL